MKPYIVLLCLSIWVLAACQRDPNDPGTEFAPQMYLSKSYEPYTQTEAHKINPLGLNMREPAPNTVPRRRFDPVFESKDSTGKMIRRVDVMAYDIPRDDAGRELADKILFNPLPVNEVVLAEGKVLYERFCTACHGAEGKGDGKVAAKYKGVANLTGAAYANHSAGRIFHVITNGKGLMWPHGAQLNPDERWKVVHYVHKLMGKLPSSEDKVAPTPADTSKKTETGAQAAKKISKGNQS
ncbi:MAG: cytochrome c [Microscillaceae bacterium]|nr:cytochrome c [Microscillaceae bacterium]